MAVLLGSQSPRLAIAPAGSDIDGEDAVFLASEYGLVPDEWQEAVIRGWMRRRKDGRWSAKTLGAAVPRQNGKNGILEVVELYFMVQLGLKILHTAHEVKTARKAFIRLCSFFENERLYPELADLVKEIRKTNGQEAIVLNNGGSVEFIARSKGSGRGYTVDCLVMDEAQELTDDALEALTPTTSAAPSGDPLTVFTGTPPSPSMNGEVFTRVRQGAVDGSDKRIAWYEWSVVGDVNLDDKSLWAATNPALGSRLNIETLESERSRFSDAGFARERLGMWASEEHLSVIPASEWARRAVGVVPDVPVAAYGVDMNPERTLATVSVGLRTEDGVHIEVAELGEVTAATDALVEWLVKRAGRRIPVVMDAYSPARSLEPILKQRGVKVFALSGNELMQACGGFYDAVVKDKSLTHYDQEQLNTALAGAKKQKLGDAGGWKWSRKTLDIDLTPLVAVTAAHYGVVKFGKRRSGSSRGKVLVL